MTERSVRCWRCAFSFARLIDAGNHHAYHCPTCNWQKPTTDRRPGNRPADVCALCDRPIDLKITGHVGGHLYVGSGWVHGGGREHIPCHDRCLTFERLDYLLEETHATEHWHKVLEYFRSNVGFYINGRKQ